MLFIFNSFLKYQVQIIELSRPPNVHTLVAPYKKEISTLTRQANNIKHSELISQPTSSSSSQALSDQVKLQAVSEHHLKRLDKTSNIHSSNFILYIFIHSFI